MADPVPADDVAVRLRLCFRVHEWYLTAAAPLFGLVRQFEGRPAASDAAVAFVRSEALGFLADVAQSPGIVSYLRHPDCLLRPHVLTDVLTVLAEHHASNERSPEEAWLILLSRIEGFANFLVSQTAGAAGLAVAAAILVHGGAVPEQFFADLEAALAGAVSAMEERCQRETEATFSHRLNVSGTFKGLPFLPAEFVAKARRLARCAETTVENPDDVFRKIGAAMKPGDLFRSTQEAMQRTLETAEQPAVAAGWKLPFRTLIPSDLPWGNLTVRLNDREELIAFAVRMQNGTTLGSALRFSFEQVGLAKKNGKRSRARTILCSMAATNGRFPLRNLKDRARNAVHQQFRTLSQIFETLLGVPGKAFECERGTYVPKFKLYTDDGMQREKPTILLLETDGAIDGRGRDGNED